MAFAMTTGYRLELDPGWIATAEPLDPGTADALRRIYDQAAPGPISVKVAADDTQDVSGHASQVSTVGVVVTFGDDVIGHALSLHFPSPDDARKMRIRLAAGGLLIAALTAGAVGVTALESQSAATTVAAAAAAAAPVAAPAPFVSRGLAADIRSGDITQEESVPAPTRISPGLAADIRSGDIIAEEAAGAPAAAPVDRSAHRNQ